ncbi:YciI family protein [Umezawaea sp. Da 62-37]|uniref:YciI family protein n=1 Tax=Umezawaea sp. Da 62-37 TaxID=3075927 RepID=UPI0028F6DFE7|nr:YciI family protein [Umezawaea sp. Da 62-37]WNV88125.1 YciI family protein [Umezawaea sp. Da 62-37]
MKYLMLIYGNETVWNSLSPADLTELIANVDGFNQDLRDSGELVLSEGLVPRARSVRMGPDAPVVTDGPYLEAKEYVGSMFVVDVDSEERAVEIARSYPGIVHHHGTGGGLEMWPLMER